MTKQADLEHVRRKGKRIRTPFVEIRFVASPLHHPRVGIIVPRYKHSAVERNRVKRRLREIARLRLLPALRDLPLDVVVRAHPSAYGAGFAALEREVGRAVERLTSGTGAGGS